MLKLPNRELKQRRRRRRGRRRGRRVGKNEVIFCKRLSRNISRRRPRSVDDGELHVVVLQRTVKKCAKIYNARAKLFFCSLKLLFCDVLVAVVVVVCLSSLLMLFTLALYRCVSEGRKTHENAPCKDCSRE